jgi:NAD(P)-dependent dehydrogenase (short-subunit alcohol dehydrogenase family)
VNTADWIEAFKVMTIGPFRVVQAFLENLKRAKNPRIMTIMSQMGASTSPMGGSYSYGNAKAAVNRVMVALAIDLRGKMIVNLIHPGWGANRYGWPECRHNASGKRRWKFAR